MPENESNNEQSAIKRLVRFLIFSKDPIIKWQDITQTSKLSISIENI